jgi:hypothetical protein
MGSDAGEDFGTGYSMIGDHGGRRWVAWREVQQIREANGCENQSNPA